MTKLDEKHSGVLETLTLKDGLYQYTFHKYVIVNLNETLSANQDKDLLQ